LPAELGRYAIPEMMVCGVSCIQALWKTFDIANRRYKVQHMEEVAAHSVPLSWRAASSMVDLLGKAVIDLLV
jgi:hypothetical protein